MLGGLQSEYVDVTHTTTVNRDKAAVLVDAVERLFPLNASTAPIVDDATVDAALQCWVAVAPWWAKDLQNARLQVITPGEEFWVHYAATLVGSDPQRAHELLSTRCATVAHTRVFITECMANLYALMKAGSYPSVYTSLCDHFEQLEYACATVVFGLTSRELSDEDLLYDDPYEEVFKVSPSEETVTLGFPRHRHAKLERVFELIRWNGEFPVSTGALESALRQEPGLYEYHAAQFVSMCHRVFLYVHAARKTCQRVMMGDAVTPQPHRDVLATFVKNNLGDMQPNEELEKTNRGIIYQMVSAVGTREYFERFKASFRGSDMKAHRKAFNPSHGYNTLPTAVQTDLGCDYGVKTLLLSVTAPRRVMGHTTVNLRMASDEETNQEFAELVDSILHPESTHALRDVLTTAMSFALWDLHFTVDGQTQSFHKKYLVTKFDLVKRRERDLEAILDGAMPRLPYIVEIFGRWYVHAVREVVIKSFQYNPQEWFDKGTSPFVLIPCDTQLDALAEWVHRVVTVHGSCDARLRDLRSVLLPARAKQPQPMQEQ